MNVKNFKEKKKMTEGEESRHLLVIIVVFHEERRISLRLVTELIEFCYRDGTVAPSVANKVGKGRSTP